MSDINLKVLLILLTNCIVTTIAINVRNSAHLREGWQSVHTKMDVVFNVSQFMNCVNINGTIINLWETEVGEYLVTPENLDVFDLDKWLDCIEDQDIGDLLVVSDGTYLVGLTSIRTRVVDGLISWVAYRHHVEKTESKENEKRSCCDGIAYDVFNNAGCKYGDTYKDGNYWPSGCLSISSKARKSMEAVNYTGRKVKFGGCPHHDCRSGCRYRTLKSYGELGCQGGNTYSIKGYYS